LGEQSGSDPERVSQSYGRAPRPRWSGRRGRKQETDSLIIGQEVLSFDRKEIAGLQRHIRELARNSSFQNRHESYRDGNPIRCHQEDQIRNSSIDQHMPVKVGSTGLQQKVVASQEQEVASQAPLKSF
jgi:hypothetical protein